MHAVALNKEHQRSKRNVAISDKAVLELVLLSVVRHNLPLVSVDPGVRPDSFTLLCLSDLDELAGLAVESIGKEHGCEANIGLKLVLESPIISDHSTVIVFTWYFDTLELFEWLDILMENEDKSCLILIVKDEIDNLPSSLKVVNDRSEVSRSHPLLSYQ